MADFDWKTFLFSFEGRIPRSDFWLKFVLPYWAILIVLSAISFALGPDGLGAILFSLINLLSLVAIWPSLAVGAKRLHDRNKSGWMQLLLLIPLIGLIWYIIDVGCLPGTQGENQYGPDPLQTPSA